MWIKQIQWDGSTQFYPNRPLRFFKKKWYHADWFFTFIDEDAVVISILRRFISQWFLYTYWFYTYGKFLNWVIPKSPWVSILFQGHPWRLNDLGYPHDCGHSNRPWHCSCRTTLMIFSARWTARWTHQKLFQKKTTTFWHWFCPICWYNFKDITYHAEFFSMLLKWQSHSHSNGTFWQSTLW